MYSVSDDPEGRVSPFGNLRIKVCLLTPRSLSQATTSFIACNRQGFHHVHLFTCPYNVGPCMSTGNVITTRVQLTMFVDTTDYYPKCASDRWISYTLKENFTSS